MAVALSFVHVVDHPHFVRLFPSVMIFSREPTAARSGTTSSTEGAVRKAGPGSPARWSYACAY